MWVRFVKDHDHVWPSRAVTAYKAGMIVSVRKEVAERAIAKRRAVETERPARNDPDYRVTRGALESGKPTLPSYPESRPKAGYAVANLALPPVTPES